MVPGRGRGPPLPHTPALTALTQLSPGGLPLLQEAQPLTGPCLGLMGSGMAGSEAMSHLSPWDNWAWQERLGRGVCGPYLLTEGAQTHVVKAVQLKGLP